MNDPVGATVVGTIAEKVSQVAARIVNKFTFSRRVARRARAAAADDGYSISLKNLRRLTRQKVVKIAMRRQPAVLTPELRNLFSGIQAKHTVGDHPTADQVLSYLRTGYLSAADQVERDLGVRDEMKAGFASLLVDGATREALWRSNLALLFPPLAADAVTLRELYGDGVVKLIHEVAHAGDRTTLLSSWAVARPEWFPAEGRVFGWLGELSFEIGASDTALTWFDAAIDAGAVPIEYWRVRRMLADPHASPEERGKFVEEIADHPLVLAFTAPEFAERLAHIRSWARASAMQTSLQKTLIVENLVSLLELDEAISTGVAAFEKESLTGPGTNAVEAFLRRSGQQPGAHASDLSAGLSLALRIRDSRRKWGLSSGVIVAKAVKATLMLSDIDGALKLSQPPESTESEAAHPEVRQEAVVAMTLMDNIEGARALFDAATPNWVRLQLEAREAELLGDQAKANELLTEAIEVVEDQNRKLSLVFRLACRGIVHPFADTIRVLNPDVVLNLELVAALFNREPGSEERARHSAVEQPTVAFSLIEFFETAGRRRDLVFIAEQAAAVWADPDLWLKAARAYFLEGQYSQAIDRAAKALDAGGSAWGSRAGAYSVQIEAASSNGDWATAAVTAQSLIRLRPDSQDAHWALVRIRRSSGDRDLAYRDWKAGPSLSPRTPHEASIWFELFRFHGSDMATLQEFFEVANQFSASEQVRNLALGALLMAPRLTEQIGDLNFNTLLAQFERDYPGQQGVRMIKLGDDAEPSDILAALQEAFGPRDADRDALNSMMNNGIRDGTLPVGFVAAQNARQVSELLNLLHQAPRFAGSPNVGDQSADIEEALKAGVIADVTSLFTLSVLTEEHAGLLAAKFPRLIATSEQMLDASSARESFNRTPGGSLNVGGGGEPVFQRTDPIEHEVQRLNGIRLVEWFRRADRQAGLPLTSNIAKEVADGDGSVWLTALDLAARTGVPLWCDDAATRTVAKEAGARTFGTPGLVEYLRRSGSVGEEVADDLDVDLVRNWTVGVAYRSSVFEEVGRLDQMAPQALAIAIRHGGSDHADEKVGFIVRAMGAVVDFPDQLSGWAAVGIRYLGQIAGAADSALDNRITFLHLLLIQPWMSPSRLLFIFNAGREEIGDDWSQVFAGAFQLLLTKVAQSTDHATASRFGLALTGNLAEDERQIALSVILAL